MKVAKYFLVSLLLPVLSVSGEQPAFEFPPPEKRPANIAELFKTAENLQIVTQAERVDVCILYPDLAPGEEFTDKVKESPCQQASPQLAKKLSARLTDKSSYPWSQEEKDCMPVYNARIRFLKATNTITADFCFGCQTLLFSRDGKALNTQDFDPINDEIFESIRGMFPRDKVILSIIEQKKRSEELRRAREEQRAKERAAVDKAKRDRANAQNKNSANPNP
jgi:hypothetical protein